MGLIKEPLNIDFYVDPRPLTKEEESMISAFIVADKQKRAKKKIQKTDTPHVIIASSHR